MTEMPSLEGGEWDPHCENNERQQRERVNDEQVQMV